MALETGSILEGKIVNITNFGAFVEVGGETGLVHISEVAESFVKDIREHLKEDDVVKVKVLGTDEKGKISLSIKQAMPPKPKTARPAEVDWSKKDNNSSSNGDRGYQRSSYNNSNTGGGNYSNNRNRNMRSNKPKTENFEDIMAKFMKDSEERLSDMKKNQEPRSKKRM
ncbi:S1 RNA-binding domain-containing protein [uncultured Clostridium sp.]|jgi:S1 RNA binding domain protein|uniref:S1 RNA-binding domain-containing protein n=1 Tax=uncultured Clostridium sp. TaxID=59620 RepID=UPI002628C6E6|nr:S1 RNA-binding domain-containing protein [uncultured Clostridium sp.]